MKLEDIIVKLENCKNEDTDFRRYAVLIPLIEIDGELQLLYEVRSDELRSQPGEICFPGGRIEPDEHAKEAAIRETVEELNIDDQNIEIIGKIPSLVTPFNIILHPYVGLLKDIDLDNLIFNTSEVKEIFTVPLEYLKNVDPEVYSIDTYTKPPENFPYHKIQNGDRYDWKSGKYPVLFYDYNDYVIWGMTARLTKRFIDKI